jgi:hypothetical protein
VLVNNKYSSSGKSTLSTVKQQKRCCFKTTPF